ncbi:MAG: metallophosphoesterase family protein, partial [Desulfohalobiaceae bacterium]
RLFYACDLHGSEHCWNKFLMAGEMHRANALILGGTLLARGIQWLVKERGNTWSCRLGKRVLEARTANDLQQLENHVRNRGLYPYRTTEQERLQLESSPELLKAAYQRLASETLTRWLSQARKLCRPAGRRVYLTPDSIAPALPGTLEEASLDGGVVWAQQGVFQLDQDHQLVSHGCTHHTPFDCVEAAEENTLILSLDTLVQQLDDVYNAVFSFHAPPHDSGLDHAPDPGRTSSLFPTGSRAVRWVIETHQPLLSLHGMVPAPGRRFARIGRTLCVNPGSFCSESVLSGMLFVLDRTGVRSFQPVQG